MNDLSTPETPGPAPQSGVLRVAPYKQGSSLIDGVDNPIKLSSNESAMGPSPRAVAAYEAAGRTLCRYPDGAQTALREAIGQVHGLDPARIVCGNGSDELLSLLIRAYVGQEDDVVLSEFSFGMCRIHATARGANIIIAPEPDLHINVDEILRALTPKTRLVAIATPNNPPGTYLPSAELQRLHAALPRDVLLIIDSAYAEYVTAADYDPGAALAGSTTNVVMTRTFSKLYGLAALRIGWCYADASIVDTVQRIRTPFNTSAPALAAATAAILDREYAAQVRSYNGQWLMRMTKALRVLGLEVTPSVTNFLFVRFPNGSRGAQAAYEFLLSRGIIPRPVGGGGPGSYLRITIGLERENDAVLAALQEFIQGR
jgi:histidinol-phosphate aminotransferase